MAGLQKTQLAVTRPIQGLGTAELGIGAQIMGGGLVHLAEVMEKIAETHSQPA
jgi:hypothetical protein